MDQVLVQGKQYFGFGCPVALETEIVGDHLEELIHRESGVEHVSELDTLRRQKSAEALEHSRFSSSDFAGKDDEPLFALHAIDEIGQSLLMLRASVKKARIGTQIERVFF